MPLRGGNRVALSPRFVGHGVLRGWLFLEAAECTTACDCANWARRAREGAGRIKDIVARMNRITRIEAAPPQGLVPDMLDIRKSSEPEH